jgi:hypothetical protein
MTLSELATQYNAARPCAVLTVNNCVQALAMLLSMNHDAPLTEESQDGAFWGYKGQIHAIENNALENTKTPFDVWVNDGSRGSTYKYLGQFVLDRVITDKATVDKANLQIENQRQSVDRIFKLLSVQQS